MAGMDSIDKLLAWAGKDWVIILVCMAALAGCYYTIHTVGNYQQAINAAWQTQWQQSGCAQAYSVPSVQFKMWGAYNESEDRSTDTKGPGN